MVVLCEGNEVWLIVKIGSPSGSGWIKVVPSLDDAIEEFVVCTKVRKENYLRIVKVTPDGSINDIIRSLSVDKEQVWKRAYEIHDKIKNRLVLEKSNEKGSTSK